MSLNHSFLVVLGFILSLCILIILGATDKPIGLVAPDEVGAYGYVLIGE